MTKRAKLLASAAALATALVTYIQSGRGPLANDPGLGVNQVVLQRGTIEMIKDAGDVSCWLKLYFRPSVMPSAVSLDQKPLRFVRDGAGWVVTDRSASKAAGPSRFTWYAGGRIQIRATNATLSAWEIFRDNGPPDSSAKERARRFYSGTTFALLFIGAIGVIANITSSNPPEKNTFMPDECVLLIIRMLRADTPVKTKRMQALLLRVVQEKKIPKRLPHRDQGLLKQGIDQLTSMLDFFVKRLAEEREVLGGVR